MPGRSCTRLTVLSVSDGQRNCQAPPASGDWSSTTKSRPTPRPRCLQVIGRRQPRLPGADHHDLGLDGERSAAAHRGVSRGLGVHAVNPDANASEVGRQPDGCNVERQFAQPGSAATRSRSSPSFAGSNGISGGRTRLQPGSPERSAKHRLDGRDLAVGIQHGARRLEPSLRHVDLGGARRIGVVIVDGAERIGHEVGGRGDAAGAADLEEAAGTADRRRPSRRSPGLSSTRPCMLPKSPDEVLDADDGIGEGRDQPVDQRPAERHAPRSAGCDRARP